MYKKHNNKIIKKNIILAIAVSLILMVSSSLYVIDQSNGFTGTNVTGTPYVASGLCNVTFTESNLASAVQWNVSLGETSQVSTTSTISFHVSNGTYSFIVANISGYTASPNTGSIKVIGSAVNEKITFASMKPVSLAPVELGTAAQYTILAKTGISTTGTTAITGNIGVSPAGSTYITGFSQTLSSTGQYATSTMVSGKIYAATYSSPTPSDLTTAVGDMQTAYTNAAGRVNPGYVNLGAGNINGMTLVPGLYKWGTGVYISTSITLTGNASSVWIFQISGGLTFGNGAHIILKGGAEPQNIFWQVASGASIGTGASFYGIIMSQTDITIATGSTMTGPALAQSAVTLEADTISAPSSLLNVTQKNFDVTFTEIGLSTGTPWNVTLSGELLKSTTSTIIFTEPNGTYSYMVSSNTTDSIQPSTGTVSVNGEHAYQAVMFSPATQKTYSVAFTETGLPSGMQWGVFMDGAMTTSVSSDISFALPNGTYSYTIESPANYGASPHSGSVVVSGKSANVSVTFTLMKYTVTFTETGLPSGITWYVNSTKIGFSGAQSGSSYSIGLTNATYSYTASSNDKSYHQINGTFSVSGHSVSESLKFVNDVKKPSVVSNDYLYIIAGVIVAVAGIGAGAFLIIRKRVSK